ncbi:MAG: hypothetical protein HS126_18870 [Anaerolineales bacterium]|nr:hypothetical protein [Anaerolineales bacterium]
MKNRISLKCKNINSIQLLLILYELLENEENSDLWAIATPVNIEWLVSEILDRERRAYNLPEDEEER